MTQDQVLQAVKNWQVRAICERYVWRFLADTAHGEENVTRQIRALEKKNKVRISYYRHLQASVTVN